jgi:hypothetical protein
MSCTESPLEVKGAGELTRRLSDVLLVSRIAFVAAFVTVVELLGSACNRQADGRQADDAGSMGGNETCDEDGGFWRCPGNQKFPACPLGTASGEPCDYDGGGCFSCYEGASIGCGCTSNNGGGDGAVFYERASVWSCIGNGLACQ